MIIKIHVYNYEVGIVQCFLRCSVFYIIMKLAYSKTKVKLTNHLLQIKKLFVNDADGVQVCSYYNIYY